jgi:outer membrane lipoprotein carrier protein
MKRERIIGVLLLALLVTSLARSDTQELLRSFESRYTAAHGLQAKFLERYYENGKLVRAEAGQAYFQRPGKMRWDYESPEKNTFLVDGKFVWFYSPSDHTATRMLTKQSEDWRTPLAFLTTHMKLSRICSKVVPDEATAPVKPADRVYACTLRNTADAPGKDRDTRFEISPAGELVRVLVPEEGGVTLEFSFGAWIFDPQLAKGLFEFHPGSDTVVVDGLLPETSGMRQ